MGGWKLMDAPKKGLARVVDQPVLDKVAHEAYIRDERGGVGPEGLEFARERESASVITVVERFDAEPISGGEKLPALAIPQRESPHPIEPLHAELPPMLVRCENHLGVGACPEAMSVGLELAPELQVVVDLAVVEQAIPAARVGHRLAAVPREIEDRKAAM